MDGMGAAYRFGSGFGQTKKTDLACAHEFSHCADGLLNGRVPINPMLIVEIDALNIEPAQTSFAGLAHIIGLAADSAELWLLRVAQYCKFGGDINLFALTFAPSA